MSVEQPDLNEQSDQLVDVVEQQNNPELLSERQQLDSILSNPEHTPDDVLGFLDTWYKDDLDGDAGVFEGYTLRQHTGMVLGQYKKYLTGSLPPSVDPKVFEFGLAMHDIGKVRAIAQAGVAAQHRFTVPLIESTMTKLEFTPAEVGLVTALVDGDPIGSSLKSGEIPKNAAKIRAMAEKSGLELHDFWQTLQTYYKADASSYTKDAGGIGSLDRLFSFDPDAGKLALAPSTQRIMDSLEQEVIFGQRPEQQIAVQPQVESPQAVQPEPLTYTGLMEQKPNMHPDLMEHVKRLAAAETAAAQPLLAAETQPPGESGLETALGLATEKAHQRAEVAINNSEFVRSPELERAVEGYYADHYRLASILDAVIDKQVTADDLVALGNKPIAENFVINRTVEELLAGSLRPDADRVDTLKRVQAITESMLFQEVCVGATTTSDQEVETVEHLFQKLQTTAIAEHSAITNSQGIYGWAEKVRTPARFNRHFPTEDSIERTVNRIKKYNVDNAWEDSRLAGQLLFHNTAFMNDIVTDAPDGKHFTLRSRSDRLATDGTFKSVTAEGGSGHSMHTNVTHWSETFMSADYKQQGSARNSAEISPATVAIPMAEMVKVAPYGRDCEYGVLQIKDAYLLNKVPYNHDVIIGATGFGGTFDTMGALGRDRTFFADNANQAKGHNYRLNLGSMTDSNDQSLAHVIQLQSDFMRVTSHEMPDYGSGHQYPQIHRLAYDNPRGSAIRPSTEPGHRMFEHITPEGRIKLGLGPFADSKVANDYGSFRDMTQEQQNAELTQQIEEIMTESKNLPQYQGKVVVPLRQGVMAYNNEGQNGDRAFGGLGEVVRDQNKVNILSKKIA